MTPTLTSLFADYKGADVPVNGVTQDSRAVKPGFVFFALEGVETNGAKFIGDAIAAGAIAIVAPRSARVFSVPHIVRHYPARALALASAELHPQTPQTLVAVTGTNGKSSTVAFLRQIWSQLGIAGASVGTLGAHGPTGQVALGFTTPTAEALHQTLESLAGQGVTHCAMEASSHGLAQYRMDGVTPAAVAFTNFTQDHLDYHTNMQGYLSAKLRLFKELAQTGTPAIVNSDDPNVTYFEDAAHQAGLRVFSYGWKGANLKLLELSPKTHGQTLTLNHAGQKFVVNLPLIGEFQALNALTAASCAIALGASAGAVLAALETLTPVKGRLEHVGATPSKAQIFVDFAHTPDGLETVLRAIRPHTKGNLYCVFGCGGDRDKGKRATMGAAAAKLADYVIITDDNPRSERPARIREGILQGCPNAVVIPDRAEAIAGTIARLQADDILIIAGKGHETGQIIGDKTLPFSDHQCVADTLSGKSKTPLWTSAEIAQATGGEISTEFGVNSLSIDTRSLEKGALFIALKDQRDGHDFVDVAAQNGAAAALVSRHVGAMPTALVTDVLEAVTDLAEAARDRCDAKRYAITGSVGKTSVKEMLAQIFRGFGPAHWPEKSFNNHWGVPLTLARMPQETLNAVFEIGMSTPGEIAPRSRLVKPHIAVITRIADAHLEGLGSVAAVAKEKAAIFAGIEAGGTLILPRDDAYFADLCKMGLQRAPDGTILSFGESEASDARFTQTKLTPTGSIYTIALDGQTYNIEINARGAHWGLNIAAALLTAKAGGLDPARAAQYLGGYTPPQGRGTIETLRLPNGGQFTLMDDSYNANPTSMRAGLAGFSQLSSGKRIAVLGEMLEIGDNALEAHLGLGSALTNAGIHEVYVVGEKMSALGDSLMGQITSHRFTDADGLMDALTASLADQDAVFVKGSNASGIGRVAAGLRGWGTAHNHAENNSDTPIAALQQRGDE